uniref:Uncharacterized protein n=1 Tax=Parascaris univalens TaxID=6257 RepID=A0A915A5W5_PARUN
MVIVVTRALFEHFSNWPHHDKSLFPNHSLKREMHITRHRLLEGFSWFRFFSRTLQDFIASI